MYYNKNLDTHKIEVENAKTRFKKLSLIEVLEVVQRLLMFCVLKQYRHLFQIQKVQGKQGRKHFAKVKNGVTLLSLQGG